MDLLVWNPEPTDWEFAVATFQAPLSTLSVKAFRPRLDTVRDSKNALAPQKVCCLQRFIVSVPNLGVSL